jgi:hypothetical protein
MRREVVWLLLLATLMGVLVYREALMPGRILFTSDDNIGAMALRERLLPGGFWRAWDDSVLAGQPYLLNGSWTNLLLSLLPLRFFQNWIHALDLIVASLGFGLFMRARGVHPGAAAVGGLAAFWLGSTFFLTYAGHIGKFGVVMFAGLALWLIERAAQRRSIAWGALAGAACGGMFVEQADVALFFSFALGPYALFALAREHGKAWGAWLRVLVPMGAVALLIAGRALWMATAFFSLDASSPEKPPEDRRQVWEYCTQWSWPPEETLEWIAPGYHGWRSGEPTGPYWGRLGRSADWEQTRQGFPNFKLETLYLGSIPMAFAVLGLALGFMVRGKPRSDLLFWGAVALVTFILGLGKFSPVYRLFFELPGMSSIRGPVKFMQVTQLALGILAAYGIQHLLTGEASRDRRLVLFRHGLVATGALMLVSALGLSMSSASAIQQTAAQGWGQAAAVIVENRTWALGHGGFLMLVAAGGLFLLMRTANPRWVWALAAVVAVDQLVVSRHYVQTVPAQGYIERNAVVDYLKGNLGSQRVYLASQGSFYNQWLSVLFPYHDLATFNVAQIRMPEDYQAFLSAVGSNPARLWQHFAVGHVIGPSGLWNDLQNNPAFRGRFELGFAFNVFPQGAGVAVSPATAAQPGQHLVARHTADAPRYALVRGWERADVALTLQRLSASDHVPFQRVLVPPDAQVPSSDAAGSGGRVDVVEYQPGRVVLKVSCEAPSVLRAGDKYTSFWRATINDAPAPVFRCDHIFLGVYVEPGMHTVVLEHRPPTGTLAAQGAGLLIALGAVVVCVRGRKTETIAPQ